MPVIAEEVVRVLTDHPEILEGIRTGKYNIFGGVIRHAPGSAQGGQIVGHLKFPGDQQLAQQSIEKLQAVLRDGVGSLQGGMDQLQQSMNVLQGLQVANLALSGLNLAVSAAGFVIVCRKLDHLSVQLRNQSLNIANTLELVSEAHNRALIEDEAKFRGLVMSAQQFCDMNDVHQLKSLILEFNQQYEFTKLVLQKHATLATSSVDRLNEISLIQDRFLNIGLLLSHVHMRIGAAKYAEDVLRNLSCELSSLNAIRVEALGMDKDLAFRIPASHMPNLVRFLEKGKSVIPALAYEADLMGLERTRPGIGLLRVNDSDEILLLAA